MKEIHKLKTIEQLVKYINTSSRDKLRKDLLKEFDCLVNYKNIKEWNNLVRICEALTIVGWGKKEPYEAIAEKWINGSYYTELQNQFFEKKQNSCKEWSKQKETYVIREDNADKTDYKISSFASQRNKLPKSPIRWSRSGNYQSSLQPLIDSLEILRNKFIKQTQPALYGNDFSYVGINLWFSYHDDKNVQGEYFYDEKDVPKSTTVKYYIRPRLEIGNLSVKNNELKLIVTRYFTKAYGYLKLSEQKKILAEDFLEIVDILADKLKKKKINYNTELLKKDMVKIFADW